MNRKNDASRRDFDRWYKAKYGSTYHVSAMAKKTARELCDLAIAGDLAEQELQYRKEEMDRRQAAYQSWIARDHVLQSVKSKPVEKEAYECIGRIW